MDTTVLKFQGAQAALHLAHSRPHGLPRARSPRSLPSLPYPSPLHNLRLPLRRSCPGTAAASRLDDAETAVAEAKGSSTGVPKEASETELGRSAEAKIQGGLESDEEVASIMEGVSFAQLCDDFQCISSPAVERTARLLARDIHDVREDRRNVSIFAADVQYSDPLRSFKGRECYRRPSWILNALEQPRVSMISMEMLSTSELVIRWRLRGSFRALPGANLAGASLDLLVISNFTLNQISGQVLTHRDDWDLSRCPPQAALLFYPSRLAWSTVQAGKDLQDSVSKLGSALDRAKGQDNVVYPDPSGDPRKFFMQEDPNRELYQFAFAVALLYLLVQFLRQVL